MSRNNPERLGALSQDGGGPAIAQSNSPLSFATPTMFVDLPSKGQFYPEDHPLHEVDQIEIRFMTAKEEDILTSPSLLKKGIAIDRMLENIIIDKRIKLTDMLIGDKNALIIAARISGFGEDYAVDITCPSCTESSSYEFNLEELETNGWDGYEIEGDDIKRTSNGRFSVTVPKTKALVEMRLLSGADEKYLTKLAANKKKKKLPETMLTDQMKRVITSVNGEENSVTVASFVDNAPSIDSRYLRGVYKRAVPNIDMKQVYTCQNCGFETEMEVPLTAKFFWAE